MNNKLRGFLGKHKRIDAIQRVIRHSKNEGYVNDVLSLEDNADLFQFASYGDMNSDKTIFHIYLKNRPHSGFFALFNSVLCAMVSAAKYGFIPVVQYNTNTCYSEKREIMGTTNAFEYYYEQPGGIRVEDVNKSARVVEYAERNALVYGKRKVGYSITDEEIENLAKIQSKYIRLNKYTHDYVMAGVENMISGKTLGVHVRGTDYNNKDYDHPTCVTKNQYIEAAKTALKENEFDRIFLATDEEAAINDFKKEFGEKVVYYEDTFHSPDGNPIHLTANDRKDHKYLSGLEVLRDMYTLSYCNGLIAGISMVSTSVLITKKSRNETFEYKKIIDNGINKTGKKFK